MRPIALLSILFLFLFPACQPLSDRGPDTVYLHGHIHTADPLQPGAQALAVRDGRIMAIGGDEEIAVLAGPSTTVVDLHGAFVMPGWIDGHAHLAGIGRAHLEVALLDTRSWSEVLDATVRFARSRHAGDWITGRGWHQEKWTSAPPGAVGGYPTNDSLNLLFPEIPVMLKHASGHALIANDRALALAGVTSATPDPVGGRIIRNAAGRPTGVLEENAMTLVTDAYQRYLDTRSPKERADELRESIRLAQDECLALGITSIQDAGSDRESLDILRDMAANGELTLRVWAMLLAAPSDLEKAASGLPWIDLGNGHLTVRAIKMYMDGALGSHGAWLLQPYADQPDFSGQPITPTDTLRKVAEFALDHGLQLCVHAIGDRANRTVLDLCDSLFRDLPADADLRWRIEHAQHLDTADIPRFARLGVIPSMQPIHCISDAPFVEKRLGAVRTALGAYAWRSLTDAGARLALGTDAPVEPVAPLPNLHAAVTRKRRDNGQPFHPEQCLSRLEGIQAYTATNAWAGFQERSVGTLSPGKWADFILMDHDLMACSDEDLLRARVLRTVIAGKVVYDATAGKK